MKEFMVEHVLPQLGAFIGVILTGVGGFFFGRRKQRAEVDSIEVNNDRAEIENATYVLKYYREMVDDLGGKLKDAITQLDEATKRIKELEDTVEMLTDELKKYKQLNRQKEPMRN